MQAGGKGLGEGVGGEGDEGACQLGGPEMVSMSAVVLLV